MPERLQSLRRLLPQGKYAYKALAPSDSQGPSNMATSQIDLAAGKAEAVPHEDVHSDCKDQDKQNLTVVEKSGTIASTDADNTPTEEEMRTLRKVSGKIPWSAYTIAFVELCERFSYYGSTAVFTNFIQHPLPPGSRTGAGGHGQSGALGMGQRASTGLNLFNSFWAYMMPLVGAWVADTYLGRFKTIQWSILLALIGHVLLTIAAAPVVLAQGKALGCFIVAIIVMGMGTGGFKSNISPLVAEQYQEKIHVKVLPTGERVIVDPIITVSRIYMYFYLMINIGALTGSIGMVYCEKYIGFYLAFLLPTALFLFCPTVMFVCKKNYHLSEPQGSPLPTAIRAVKLAMKGRWHLNPISTVRHMKRDDFWPNIKPSYFESKGIAKPAVCTWDDLWIDELRRGCKACAVFCWYPLYWLTYNQMVGNLTSQAATMTLNGLPNDILQNLNPFTLIIFIPLVDQFGYPFLARIGYPLTPLKRITLGFWTGTAAMIWAAVLQYYIYKTSNCGHYASNPFEDAAHTIPCVSPLNVWIQTGSYVLIALSEILASITGLEYAFSKAPKNMRSIVMSLFLFTSAISTALGQAFISLSADPLLIANYGLMAGLSFVGGLGFWLTFRNLDASEAELNYLSHTQSAGQVNVQKDVEEGKST